MMTNEQVSSDRDPNTQPPHPWEVCFEGPGFRFCIPITSTGPTIPVQGGASPANLALAAGELHGKLYRALLKSFEQAGKNRQRFLKGEIRQLVTAAYPFRRSEQPRRNRWPHLLSRQGYQRREAGENLPTFGGHRRHARRCGNRWHRGQQRWHPRERRGRHRRRRCRRRYRWWTPRRLGGRYPRGASPPS